MAPRQIETPVMIELSHPSLRAELEKGFCQLARIDFSDVTTDHPHGPVLCPAMPCSALPCHRGQAHHEFPGNWQMIVRDQHILLDIFSGQSLILACHIAKLPGLLRILYNFIISLASYLILAAVQIEFGMLLLC